jgi:trans-aconitate methyltransferase
MNKNFDIYAKYYNLLYQDKDYPSEVLYISKLIQRLAPETRDILELGAGTGKHARILADMGFIVHGIDCSKEMLAMAEGQKTPGLTFELADITSHCGETRYDVAVSLFHVISYITDNEKLLTTFKNIHTQLRPGGILIFDVWYSPAVYHQYPKPRVKSIKDEQVKITRKADPTMSFSMNTVNVNYDVLIEDLEQNETVRFQEVHSMRHFSQPEIALIADITGFDVIGAEEFLSGEEPGPDTWSVCYILKKKIEEDDRSK